MEKHKRTHNVLNGYCWTCKQHLQNMSTKWSFMLGELNQGEVTLDDYSEDSNPGKAATSEEFVMPMCNEVVWADGTRDTLRNCVLCENNTCKDPVHLEKYIVTVSPLAKSWDALNPTV